MKKHIAIILLLTSFCISSMTLIAGSVQDISNDGQVGIQKHKVPDAYSTDGNTVIDSEKKHMFKRSYNRRQNVNQKTCLQKKNLGGKNETYLRKKSTNSNRKKLSRSYHRYGNHSIVDKTFELTGRRGYIPGEILVTYKKGYPVNKLMELHRSLGCSLLKEHKRRNVHKIKLPAGLSMRQAIEKYSESTLIKYVRPHFLRYHNSTVPNDPHFGLQWGLHNTGQDLNGKKGTIDSDMDAPEAWDRRHECSNVIIAVIGGGIVHDHPDLAGNIWFNPGEILGDGIDNDGNGYTDDVNGWNFAFNNNDVIELNPSGHDTMIAGVIAALGNNAAGIAGVCWETQIMPIRVDKSGAIGIFEEIQAIDYAVANGAKVINCSFGGYLVFDEDERRAIEDAQSAGVLFVCSAGNDGKSTDVHPHYPSCYGLDNIISVGASDQNDRIWSFSNYGAASVDVIAPGENIYSTIPAREVLFCEDFQGVSPDDIGSQFIKGGTNNYWGTYQLDEDDIRAYGDNDYWNPYRNNSDGTITSIPINTTGKERIVLTYWVDYETELNYDYLMVEVFDGIDWQEITKHTGCDWGYFYFDITKYSNSNLKIRFTWHTDSSVGKLGCELDDIVITCARAYAGSEYDFGDGTSLAAPYVSGLAGLLFEAYPNASFTDIKNIILNSVDVKPEFADKCLSSGRINANNAISLLKLPGDINGDGKVELEDLVISLQILGRIIPAIELTISGDVDNDQKIGLPEALYALQYVAGLRSSKPTAEITRPIAGSTFTQGQSIAFVGIGRDIEDGFLTETSLVWISDKDGQIGTGSTFVHSTLSVGTHMIMLTVTDSDGLTDFASVTIEVFEGGTESDIIPGAGAGSIILGEPFQNVLDELGPPDDTWPDEDYWTNYFLYDAIGISGAVVDENKNEEIEGYESVESILLLAPYSGKTAGNNGIGSCLISIEDEFGPAEEIFVIPGGHSHWYWSQGICFDIENDTVTCIFIFEAS